ncbi:Superfamily I DNA and/or RNA helicase [Ruminococcus sp. YE71]|uniref:DUF3320 domain-containing protein n=1 Tax=unclassified Ruminococcus TaxID=2608920 RepID=UPI00088B38E2|nr:MULTISPECIES: DUF3320 domain-containing protein [unclassified Ruminococcus]SDA10013.1 Superfamily I DNA and/or RNA helicase [Ruminococcus sp. YE78]SFW11170.1 Superfamily I DNA and/or RNA helicase [Ruminococcus sp. YE71]
MSFSAEVDLLTTLNLAMQQNYIPLIKSIVVRNDGDTPVYGLHVRVTSEPEFVRDFTADIEKAEPHQPVELSPVRLLLSTEYLFSLTENMAAIVRVEITADSPEGGETTLWCEDKPVDLMPHNHWLGTRILPEMTAAFVTPNHPAVSQITAKAASYLAEWTGDPSFTGYLTRNPNIVKKQAAALYAALQAENIAYIVPPPSYNSVGQRVRLADTVLTAKQGTCIDLALLYASCLEAAGINPLVVVIEGHAFAGFWLEKQTFPECVNDDPAALTKRAARGIDELCLIECTAFTAGKDSTDFENAERLALSHLDDTAAFDLTIDIARCRASGIRPIPMKLEEADRMVAADCKSAANTVTAAPKDIDMNIHGVTAEAQELTKQAVWERKLLDLSLRNSLLNFRPGAMSVQLMTAELARLEDEISRGESFKIMPMPAEQSFKASDSKIFELENNAEQIKAISESEFTSFRLRSFCHADELEIKLKKLHRSAKQSLEENGANTLYLALGFLKWFETDRSEKPRYAPLVLIPVDLVKNLRERAYSLRIRDEDAQMNVTLLEMLRQDHGITVSGLDPLPQDESGADLALVFNTMRQSVMAKPRWDVEEAAFIGQFSFSQFIMWNDLKNRSDDLAKNKVVRSLMSGRLEWEPQNGQLDVRSLDSTVKPADMAIPTSADSSQLAAIYAAAQGESFVLHGPPGTGKSQTITNLIANALFSGKSVLFVAEKMAALSVVQNRLAKIGLDPFCLELHSNKAQKRAVLSQLEATLNVGRIKEPSDYARTAENLHLMRERLNTEIERLHRKMPVGMTLYDAIVGYDPKGEFAPLRGFTQEYAATLTPELHDRLRNAVSQTAAVGTRLGDISASPLRDYIMCDYSPEIRDRFLSLCRDTAAAADRERTACEKLCAAAKESLDLSAVSRKRLTDTAEQLSQKRAAVNAERAELDRIFEKSVFDLNAAEMKLNIKRAEQKWALPQHFALKKLAKELDIHCKQTGTVTKDNLAASVERLIAYGEQTAELTALEQQNKLANESEAAEFCRLYDEEKAARAEYDRVVNGDFAKYVDITACNNSENVFEAVTDAASKLARNSDRLRERSALQRSLNELNELGAGIIGELYMSGKVPAEKLSAAFDHMICRTVIDTAFRDDPAIGTFSEAQFDDEVERYRETLDSFSRLTVQELCARLSANVPNTSAGKGSSELATLQKAIRSGGRMLSIRKLFDQIPNLLRRICPCMLMSPISVAQYIDPNFPKFDLVVFDEASQLPTAEAVGAIARGENVVVVGDPRQLPPTSFFSTAHIDEENYDKEDLESVLDDCLALTMPSKHLLWHYRSRHESLIAFSNARFYENKLLTFPSPDDLDSKVSWVHVDGVYDKGKTKQNRAEGEAVVAEICRRLRDPVLCRESIGVVTFSIVQQNLIDDLLSDAFLADPSLETAANAMYEPIIIKNLENVQGDERDVILFSVGYGPDKDGKVSMNFGPLNRDGGWRRLNVAVSRARKAMTVYSTLRPEQIDMSRTRSDGVEQLKAFLEFAAKGKQALAVNAADSRTVSDGFAEELAERLRREGYDVRTSVGCSGYRVDLAIVDPDEPSRYLLGVICDGRQHFDNATARDRHIVQPSVLEGLGWKLHTVHALDWLNDHDKVVEDVKTSAEDALYIKRNPPEPEDIPEPPKPIAAPPIEFEREEAPSPLAERCEKYSAWEVQASGTSKDFYLPETLPKIAENIGWIIEAEAPVSLQSVKKRIIAAWGISRAGSKVDAVFLEAVNKAGGIIREYESGAEFIWAAWQLPDAYDGCRVPAEGEKHKRPLDEIAPEEIAAAAQLIISEQIAMSVTDLERETARLFGCPRLTDTAKASLSEGIGRAQELGKIIISEDKVTMP